MKVALRRNMFLGGTLYERDLNGNEIPDNLNGVPVKLYSKENAKALAAAAEKGEDAPFHMLPFDAHEWTAKGPAMPGDLLHNSKQEPVALSQLGGTKKSDSKDVGVNK